MHVGYMYGGIWTSLLLTFVIGFIVSHCMLILVRSAHRMYIRLRIPRLSYPDLAEIVFATGPWKCVRRCSKPIRYIIETCIFVEMCGNCCVYEIMIAHTMKKALEHASPTIQSINMNERLYIICVMGPLILICMIRSLKFLAPFTVVANIFIGISVVTTIYYSLTNTEGRLLERPAWKNFHGVLRFNGICLYAIDGLAVTLPIENNMKKPKYFQIILQYGIPIVITCAAAIGFFGYWGWGEKCQSLITIHMPDTLKRGIWERFFRVLHVILITCVSVAYPDLVGIAVFLGNFFIAVIAFIFPALIESFVSWRDPYVGNKRWLLFKNGLLLAFGGFTIISAFYSMDVFEYVESNGK